MNSENHHCSQVVQSVRHDLKVTGKVEARGVTGLTKNGPSSGRYQNSQLAQRIADGFRKASENVRLRNWEWLHRAFGQRERSLAHERSVAQEEGGNSQSKHSAELTPVKANVHSPYTRRTCIVLRWRSRHTGNQRRHELGSGFCSSQAAEPRSLCQETLLNRAALRL